jgi:double-stranded uracil-DNA glycosylase
VSTDPTLDAYETRASEWVAGRPPTTGRSASFGASLTDADAPVVDLGCGPGWHLPDLPPGAIALDGAAAMLARVPEFAGLAPRVRADLRALPFRRQGLGAVWANKSYVHLDRRAVPMAMWDLHRAVRVGGRVALGLFGDGDADDLPSPDHRAVPDDPLPGRRFSSWPDDLLDAVLEGAGFTELDRSSEVLGATTYLTRTLRRERTLADCVGPDLRLLLVGLNPSSYAADAGVGFARPGNRMWPALLGSGLAAVDRDPVDLLGRGVGMTDLVKRATARADELDRSEFEHGLRRLETLCRWLEPRAVCVVGVTGWRAATGDRRAAIGPQERTVGGRPVHVAPNPSGVNAHTSVADLVDHLLSAVALGARTGPTP